MLLCLLFTIYGIWSLFLKKLNEVTYEKWAKVSIWLKKGFLWACFLGNTPLHQTSKHVWLGTKTGVVKGKHGIFMASLFIVYQKGWAPQIKKKNRQHTWAIDPCPLYVMPLFKYVDDFFTQRYVYCLLEDEPLSWYENCSAALDRI